MRSEACGGDGVKKAIVADANDVKTILAQHFGVPETSVIKSQYSYTIVLEDDAPEEEK